MVSRVQIENRSVKRKVYYISMVGTDANDKNGVGIPRNVHNFFDVKSNMELLHYGVNFLSAQDLVSFQTPKAATKTRKMNIYQLVQSFIRDNRDDIFFLDEVPLLKGKIVSSYSI